MPIVESLIDQYIFPTDPSCQGDVGHVDEFQAGLVTLTQGSLSSEATNAIINAFAHRSLPTKKSFIYLLGLIDQVNPAATEKDISSEELSTCIDRIASLAMGHEALVKIAKPIEVELSPEMAISLKYGVVHYDFEAVGGIHFFMQDGPNDIPLFSLKGNPEQQEGKMAFNIRALQPWAAYNLLVSTLSSEYFWDDIENEIAGEALEDWDRSRESISQAKEIFSTRRRKMDLLKNRMNKGQSLTGEKMRLREHDIFLLLGISYLQGIGVDEIRGISHDKHPSVDHINYDQLFERWTNEVDSDPLHPWILHKGQPSGYVPNFLRLPAGMRLAAMKVYQEASRK